jgi:steroid delta-isomerase-like uncharacterized protein
VQSAEETNRNVVRRWIEDGLGKGNMAVAAETFAPDCRIRLVGAPQDMRGPDAFLAFLGPIAGAFPDLRMSIDEQVADGDRVMTRWTATGTHKVDLMGAKPTGKQVTFSGVACDRIDGGRVVERWEIMDQLGLLQQVGLVPTPGQP